MLSTGLTEGGWSGRALVIRGDFRRGAPHADVADDLGQLTVVSERRATPLARKGYAGNAAASRTGLSEVIDTRRACLQAVTPDRVLGHAGRECCAATGAVRALGPA